MFHGGALTGKRKVRRPLCTKRPLHIVLKTKERNLYRQKSFVEKRIKHHANTYGLRIYSIAINLDHAHLVVKIPNRELYKKFIRALTGNLAKTLGDRGVWALLPFTRMIQWGRDFRNILLYLKKNREEVSGVRVYEKRVNWYGRYLKFKNPT